MCIYIYVYIYICVYIYVYRYIYVYIYIYRGTSNLGSWNGWWSKVSLILLWHAEAPEENNDTKAQHASASDAGPGPSRRLWNPSLDSLDSWWYSFMKFTGFTGFMKLSMHCFTGFMDGYIGAMVKTWSSFQSTRIYIAMMPIPAIPDSHDWMDDNTTYTMVCPGQM